jgi:hypothetical protein
LFIESRAKGAIFEPILFEVMVGSMETGFSLIEEDLTMVAHPDFVDWFNRDEGAAQGGDCIRESVYGAVVNRFKDKEIARADEMTGADPGLNFFLSLRR